MRAAVAFALALSPGYGSHTSAIQPAFRRIRRWRSRAFPRDELPGSVFAMLVAAGGVSEVELGRFADGRPSRRGRRRVSPPPRSAPRQCRGAETRDVNAHLRTDASTGANGASSVQVIPCEACSRVPLPPTAWGATRFSTTVPKPPSPTVCTCGPSVSAQVR